MKNIKDDFERGLEKGIELGEMNEKIKIARNMLKKGYDLKEIIELTDLTKKIILSITEDLSN